MCAGNSNHRKLVHVCVSRKLKEHLLWFVCQLIQFEFGHQRYLVEQLTGLVIILFGNNLKNMDVKPFLNRRHVNSAENLSKRLNITYK